MKPFIILCCLVMSYSLLAFEVVTSQFKGAYTGIVKPITIVLPNNYNRDQQYHVIYVLHGFSGLHSDWTQNTNIAELADQYNVIVVNPDGNYGSWYIDSDINKQSQYETYIAKDVVNFIDSNYATRRAKQGRAITGLSMGGVGALHIAINHQETFAAVSAMSAGVDLRPFSAEFGLAKVLGDYATNKQKWHDLAIINNLHKLAEGNTQWKKSTDSLAIMLDIGSNDFFIAQNRALHRAMLELRIRHDYVERAGAHDWHYWSKVLPYQFLFLTSHMVMEE
ncbi:alpha/beta hydrolase [Pseudoalteromonas mariniglutinosa]|uniref:alpha/beta hydrolase n=1 Tax=Pseudoalteromonas mariniglutinosa TaxID=206042 RepID=UPI003850835A